jgi:hypothetical protein
VDGGVDKVETDPFAASYLLGLLPTLHTPSEARQLHIIREICSTPCGQGPGCIRQS